MKIYLHKRYDKKLAKLIKARTLPFAEPKIKSTDEIDFP